MARSISGLVTLEGQPYETDVVAVSVSANPRVLNTGRSDSNGVYTINVTPWDGEVMVYAVQDYGNAWAANTALNVGDVIHPTTPNGYIFEVTTAGTTGATEPTWPSQTTDVTDGTVQYTGVRLIQPVINGYVTTTLDSPSLPPAALFAQGARGIWIDPSDITTLYTDVAMTTNVVNDGDRIAAIRDKSGSNNHLIQDDAAQRPIYRVGVNQPYIESPTNTSLSSMLPFIESMPFNQDHVVYFAGSCGVNTTYNVIRAGTGSSHRTQKRSFEVEFTYARSLTVDENVNPAATAFGYKLIFGTGSENDALRLRVIDDATNEFKTTGHDRSYLGDPITSTGSLILSGNGSGLPLNIYGLLCVVSPVDETLTNFESGLDDYFEYLFASVNGN